MEIEEKSDADVMAEAREYLEENGWWRGAVVGPNGHQACGMGAVALTQGWFLKHSWIPDGALALNPVHRHQLERVLDKVVDAVAPGDEFTHWNDHTAKDKQAVLDAFAKAEKIERAGFDPDA